MGIGITNKKFMEITIYDDGTTIIRFSCPFDSEVNEIENLGNINDCSDYIIPFPI